MPSRLNGEMRNVRDTEKKNILPNSRYYCMCVCVQVTITIKIVWPFHKAYRRKYRVKPPTYITRESFQKQTDRFHTEKIHIKSKMVHTYY